MTRYAILEQRFPKKNAVSGDWEANWRRTGVEYDAECGEDALAMYRAVRSVCINPIAAEPLETK